MAAVGLMNNRNNIGVLGCVTVCNFSGCIFGAVINNDNLDATPPRKQAFDTFFHVFLGVVAGNGNGEQLHFVFSSFLYSWPLGAVMCCPHAFLLIILRFQAFWYR